MNKNAVVTGVLLLVVFIVGFGLGRYTAGTPTTVMEDINNIEDFSNAFGDEATPSDANSDTAAQTGNTGTTIQTNSLSDSQRQMIEALGIDADSITITPEMIACAEAKLGAARIAEIKNGATVSFSEGMSLAACYR